MTITNHPLHRSGRALLTHPAPALGDDAKSSQRIMVQEAGYTFTFLSDPKLEAIRRYDLVHASDDPTLPAISGSKDADIARPAEFLIDPSGTIRWRMVTENFSVRPRAEHVREAAKSLP